MLILLIIGAILLLLLSLKFYAVLTLGKCNSDAQLIGKTVIVTGASRGIGYYTALDLAERKARVIITSENIEELQAARKTIIQATNNPEVVAKHLDLTSLSNIRKFTNDIADSERRLDILINNAGALGLPNTYTEDGLLIGLQINIFGPFLLTILLIGLMKRTGKGRIINVASVAAQSGFLDLNNINRCPTPIYSGCLVYNNSKLLLVYVSWELARILRHSGITVNFLHPGLVYTKIYTERFHFYTWYHKIFGRFYSKDAKQGAQTSIHLAVSEDIGHITGRYFVDCQISKPLIRKSQDVIDSVWKQCVELVKLQESELQVLFD